MTRIVTVTSGKRGVGKTTLAVNLAVQLAQRGQRVCLLDAGTGNATVSELLGVEANRTLRDLAVAGASLEDVLLRNCHGIDIIPSAADGGWISGLGADQLNRMIDQLGRLDTYDFIIIDSSSAIAQNMLAFALASPEVVLVITPDSTSLTDAYALIKVLTNKYHQKKFKILVNAARSAGEAERIYRQLGLVVDQFLGSPSLDYMGWVPFDKLVPAAVRQQQMVLQRYPRTPASLSFLELAKRVSEEGETSVFEGDIKFFWRRLLNF